MRTENFKNLLFLAMAWGLCAPAFAAHGKLETADRDSWINQDLDRLAQSGLLRLAQGSSGDITNLQVAQLTKETAEIVLAQAAPGAAAPSPDSSESLKRLVEEFKKELSALGMNLLEWEDRIDQLARTNEEIAKRQKEYSKKTGTQMGGISKGFFEKTTNSPTIASFNARGFVELQLRSVPIPELFFDGRFRATRTFGQYFDAAVVDLRWIQLSAAVDKSSFTLGDYYESYTPLILWNPEVSRFTLYEPLSYERNRADDEELYYMDHGSEWHFRGIQGSILPFLGEGAKESIEVKVMGGRIEAGSSVALGSYYAGTQSTLSLFDGAGSLTAAGLLLWNDRETSTVAYTPGFDSTYLREYRAGSLIPAVKIKLAPDAVFSASAEYAGANYRHDQQDPSLDLQDWALLGNASLDVAGFHAKAKYLNVGSFYYAPGAQTARFDVVLNYKNNFLFNNLSKPTFANYNRLNENIFPYGDATPNREGWIGALSGELGEKGWIKPQVQGVLAREIQANFVQDGGGNPVAVEDISGALVPTRQFTGLEGALALELAKPLGLSERTFDVGVGYKWQNTDLSGGLEGLTVSTLTAGTDFSLPIPGFESLLVSAGLTLGWANGSEFSPMTDSSVAYYPFYHDTPASSFVYQPMDVNSTKLVFGVLCPLSKDVRMKADLFIENVDWNSAAIYPQGWHFLRFTYEAKF